MAFGESLERLERTDHEQEVSLGVVPLMVGRHGTHHEVAHAAAVEVGNVSVSVAHFGAEREEERGFGESQRAAVGKQPVNGGAA